ncbi:helix-turn-helix transcriptional regulator [Streptomyces sp. NRRL S-87]|uniref:helix-turn-helix transcriptional regulator n=1 Tax=Streptomyces sp. NRRL S-87 TaxID=1463920 RepID=UPI000A57EBDD|nr:AraC family transcriptional regulator [Streptomyces sp. NRRL S-87]
MERAIACIREHYGEPLALARIAESALLSRFYLTRRFKEETGLTPGRFLAAVRIDEAKRLIEQTSMSITEVSRAVGYNSLGSFTNYFTASVGVSPGRFRRLARDGGDGLPAPAPAPGPWPGAGAIGGTISLPAGHGNARVFLGAFATPVVQHPCVASAVLDVPSGRPCCYSLQNVPEGSWHLLAVAVADGLGPDRTAHRTPLVGGRGVPPVPVTADGATSAAVRLRPGRPTDPPVLLALPELVPPVTFVPPPGCPSASTTPLHDTDDRRRAAGHLRLVSAAPAP